VYRPLLRLLLTDILQHIIIFVAAVVYNVSILHTKFAGTNTGTLQFQSIYDSSLLFIFFSPTGHALLKIKIICPFIKLMG
jgi:hypothetical protein